MRSAVRSGPGVGAALGGSKAADQAVHAAEDAAAYTIETLENGVKVIVKGGVIIFDALGDAAKALFNVAQGVVAFRPLRPSELRIARAVFGESLPLDRVVVSSLSGLGGRPFTIPGTMLMGAGLKVPGLQPILELWWFVRGLQNKYILFLGADGYNHPFNWARDKGDKTYLPAGALVKHRDGATLIHELTHVWEGHYGSMPWGYVFGSLWKQCACIPTGGSAYAVTAGSQWNSYGPEQQARLIESYYILTGGGPVMDPVAQQYEDYVTSNIRTGQPNATTVFKLATRVSLGGIGAPFRPSLLAPSSLAPSSRTPSTRISSLHAAPSTFKFPPK